MTINLVEAVAHQTTRILLKEQDCGLGVEREVDRCIVQFTL